METEIRISENEQLESDSREDFYVISSPAGMNYNKIHENSTANHTAYPPSAISQTSPPSTSYRIPSSVFARTKSNAPTEWSVTSNDSLFSLYPGNASFAGDQFSNILSTPRNDEITPESLVSGPLLNFSQDKSQLTNYSRDAKPPEISEQVSHHYRKGGENGADLIKEVSLAKGVIHKNGPILSDESCKSFAFPVLTMNDSNVSIVRRGGTSTNRGTHSQPQTPKDTNLYSSPSYHPQPTKDDEFEKLEPIGTPTSNVACCTWWSCFPSSWRYTRS